MKRIILLLIIALQISIANAQWTQCPLFGGHVFSLATNGTTVFAGTSGDALFKSDDYGSNWYASNNGLHDNKYVYSIAIRGNEIYAGIDWYGMYKSTDNGATWTSINTGLPSVCFGPRSILFKGNDIFVSTPDGPWGIYMSSDSGNTWNCVNNGLADTTINCMVSDSTGIYAGSGLSGGIYKTTDNGANWFPSNSGLPSTTFSTNAMAIKDDIIYAGISLYSTGSNIYRVYKSTNGGANWTLSAYSPYPISELAVCGNQIFMGTSDGVYQSTNGTNWTAINAGLDNKQISSFAVYGGDIFAGTSGGVFLLSDSSSAWVSVNNGINSFSIKAIENIGNNLFVGENTTGIYMTTDFGNSWEVKNNGITDLQIDFLEATGTEIIDMSHSGIFRTSNFGDNWSEVPTGIPSSYSLNSYASSGSNAFVATSNGIFRSTDNGTTWSASNTGLTSTSVRSVATNVYGNVYAAVFDIGIFLSPDNGTNWIDISNGFPGIFNINCITTSGTYIYAGLGNYNPPVVFSNNDGATWKIGNNGLFGHEVKTLKTIGNTVFAGLNDGVFYTNNGVDWIDKSDNLPAYSVISVGRDDSCIYVGLQGHGIWKRPLADFPIDFTDINKINIPSDITIFPNPATDLLYIKSGEGSIVEIRNMQGQLLLNEKTEKEKPLDISSLKPGVYLVCINSGNERSTRKLVVYR